MRVIDVLPLSKGVFRESLSYFTKDEHVSPGMLVSVPVRNRSVHALVLSVRSSQDIKADIKSSAFSLKKVEKVKGKPLLFKEFLEAAEETAKYFAGSNGAVLSSLIPKVILGSPEFTASREEKDNASTTAKEKKVREIFALQASDEERFSEYKSLVRERFARGLSVYLCFPTMQEAEELLLSLDRGIREYSFLLHGGLPKAKILSTWKTALSEKHPVLIIGTGAFLSIPRPDIGTIIIEREASRFYKLNTRPYADIRVFAEYYARRKGLELILGDIALRIETLYKVETGEYTAFGGTVKSRSLWSGTYKIVDMRAPHGTEEIRKFEIVSSELKKLIEEGVANNERTFIFTARRGLSPLTVCGDCGTVVNCTRCSAPTTLHRGDGHTFFLCHHCGERRDTLEKCRVCGSWKLETVGIGIELVEKTLKSLFPHVKIFRLDRDSAKTNAKAREISSRFYKSPGSILLGTETAIYYLNEKVENSAVVSIDSLFSLPDFRINERIFSTLIAMRAKTEKKFILQTRNIEASVLAHAAVGTLGDFYREETELRKKFNYPPYSVLIKISLEGKRDIVEKEITSLEEYFKGYVINIFSAFIQTVKGKTLMNALLEVKREEWPNDLLISKLRNLPPFFRVQVDPESIL